MQNKYNHIFGFEGQYTAMTGFIDSLIGHDISQISGFLERYTGHYIAIYIGYEIMAGSQGQVLLDIPQVHLAAYTDMISLSYNATIDTVPHISATPLISDEAYVSAIYQAMSYMQAGHTYVLNLTRPFQLDISSDISPTQLYFALQSRLQMPYSLYFSFGDSGILSFSPECLLQKKSNKIITSPIKGTISDSHPSNITKLQNDPKENAEHLMIVDLLRNDIGKIATPHSVQVSNYAYIQRCPNIYHMMSDIEGIVPDDINNWDIIQAIMPGGSVTGTPKHETMRIISELEPYSRHAYTGTAGYICPNGDMTLNILIRTIQHDTQRYIMNTGCGITVDSDPIAENQETYLKLHGIINA